MVWDGVEGIGAVYRRSLAAPEHRPPFLGTSQSGLFFSSRCPPNPRSCLCGDWSPRCPQKNCSSSMLTFPITCGISWVTGWRTSPGESPLPRSSPPAPSPPTFPLIRFSCTVSGLGTHYLTFGSLDLAGSQCCINQTMHVDTWNPLPP